MGSVVLFCGPMFSGKTQRLLEHVALYEAASKSVTAFKPAVDTRNPGELVSHSGIRHPATEFHDSKSLIAAAEQLQAIVIDEAQFLDQRSVEAVRRLARDAEVTIAGLDLDFRSVAFPSVMALIEIADDVRRLTARCTRCGGVATHTQRLINGLPAPNHQPVQLVGGGEIYQPRCANCYRLERVEGLEPTPRHR